MAKGKDKAKAFTKKLGHSYLGKQKENSAGEVVGTTLGQPPTLMHRTALCVAAVTAPKGPGNSVACSSPVSTRVPRGSCQLLPDGEDVSITLAASRQPLFSPLPAPFPGRSLAPRSCLFASCLARAAICPV